MMLDSLSPEFLLTALLVVLAPGTGVIYTLSYGLFGRPGQSMTAAIGCTFGIVPHLLASVLGLAALLHTSAVAFQVVKLLGVAYLLYLAWGLWRESGALAVARPDDEHGSTKGHLRIMARGALINILNPKLSIFFLAFLPQFVPQGAPDAIARFFLLAVTFMVMTFAVFVIYGFAAEQVSKRVLASARAMRWLQRTFAAAFAGFAVKLALTER
ncbi:LysE family translocator [Nisaea sp.]|uniref:LysE family translocator n=2 Tax=Nisaea sp. TaxID=2024842 RepID=UPI00326718BD